MFAANERRQLGRGRERARGRARGRGTRTEIARGPGTRTATARCPTSAWSQYGRGRPSRFGTIPSASCVAGVRRDARGQWLRCGRAEYRSWLVCGAVRGRLERENWLRGRFRTIHKKCGPCAIWTWTPWPHNSFPRIRAPTSTSAPAGSATSRRSPVAEGSRGPGCSTDTTGLDGTRLIPAERVAIDGNPAAESPPESPRPNQQPCGSPCHQPGTPSPWLTAPSALMSTHSVGRTLSGPRT
jgi:hypothetical protein